MQELAYIFIIFIFYSCFGWVMETCLGVYDNKKFINRGFLIGPYCPIYGIGASLAIILLSNFKDSLLLVFIISFVGGAILEYSISYIMEKLFKARWWDYSHLPLNLNGRICFSNCLLFGIGGVLIILCNSYIQASMHNISTNIFNPISFVIFIFFIVDIILSYLIINSLKLTILKNNADNSEEISTSIIEVLKNKYIAFKRLVLAFPNIKISIKKKKSNK